MMNSRIDESGHRAVRSHRSPWGDVLVLLLLCCAMAVPAQALPPSERAPAPANSIGAAGNPPATLDALLAYAKRHAPQMGIAAAGVARAQANVAGAAPSVPKNPILMLGAGPRVGSGGAGVDFRVQIRQAVAIGGQIKQRRRAAAATVKVAHAGQTSTFWRLHIRIHQLFFVVLVAKERVQQAQTLVSFSDSLRKMVSKQAQVGQRAPMALLLMETDVARARENLALAEFERDSALAQLQRIIGWRGSPLSDVAGTLPPTTHKLNVADLQARMLRTHPNLKRLAASLVSANETVNLADRMARPNLVLGMNYSREASSGPGAGGAEHVVVALVRIPLQVSQKNQGPRARARANVLLAKARIRAEEQRLIGLLQVAMLDVKTARKRLQLYSKAIIPALQRNLDLLLKAFAVGEVDLNTVSLTRQRLLQATQRYIDARRRYFLAAARVEGVVGHDIFGSEGNKP